MIDYYAPKLDLTLLGCGFLGVYHLGAIYLLGQVWPRKPYDRICGASCGGLLGAFLIAGLKLELVLGSAMAVLRQLRAALRRPTHMSSAWTIGELVERSLERLLPADAHLRCSHRLGLSVTKVGWPMENRFLSSFRTRRELIDAVCAGCFIPLWSGSLFGPKLAGGSRFIDGAYSDNSPKFADRNCASARDEISQAEAGHADAKHNAAAAAVEDDGQPAVRIELSPFASQVEVSPKGERALFKARVLGSVYLANWNNLVRTWHAMIPFHLANYKPYLLAGHRDMKEYLLGSNLIKCRQCHASSVATRANGGDARNGDDLRHRRVQTKCDTAAAARNTKENKANAAAACLRCLMLFERVDSLRMSDELLNMVDE